MCTDFHAASDSSSVSGLSESEIDQVIASLNEQGAQENRQAVAELTGLWAAEGIAVGANIDHMEAQVREVGSKLYNDPDGFSNEVLGVVQMLMLRASVGL
jgi:hypothetical protein